jgi:two-component system, NtrC family, response regulator AtoC
VATIEDLGAGNSLPPEELILGVSETMGDVREAVEHVSRTRVPILIQGEAGTGKETLAEIIHRRYPGEETPFLKAGRAEIQDNFLLTLGNGSLRAAARGSNSDAAQQGNEPCLGTLFVSEVAELPLSCQRKLFGYFHEEPQVPSSLAGTRRVRPRLICTTTSPLEREVESDKFLQEVFHSINLISLHMPPLRDRRADIPQIVQYYWGRLNRKLGGGCAAPSSRLTECLQQYNWPGNIREVASVMRRYVLLGSEEEILAELAGHKGWGAGAPSNGGSSISLKKVVRQAAREVEQKIILQTLRNHGWNRRQTARALNISYRALLYKAKEAGVPPKRMRGTASGGRPGDSSRPAVAEGQTLN